MRFDLQTKRSSWITKPVTRWAIFVVLLGSESFYLGWMVGASTALLFLFCDVVASAHATKKNDKRFLFWGRLLALIVAFLVVGVSNAIVTSKTCDSHGNCKKIFLQ